MRAALLVLLLSPAYASPKPPHGATKIAIHYERSGWTRQEESHVIEWTEKGYVVKGVAIEAKLVDELYASLTDLRDATQKLRCFSHTDDYPKWKIVVESATEPLVIETDSNCSQYRPWTVEKGGKLYAQFTGKAWSGVGGLLAAVNKDWEKRRSRASLGGIEMIQLGEYPRSTSGEPAACAKSFEGHAELKALFADPALRVDELGLTCELGQSADCTTANARAELVWRGVNAHVVVPCSKGQVRLPAGFADKHRALRALVDSAPVRALVKLSPKPPRLWGRNGWGLDTMELGLPNLHWAEGGTTVNARVIGRADARYWKELGLDPAKLPRIDGGIEVTLDFAGKVVK